MKHFVTGCLFVAEDNKRIPEYMPLPGDSYFFFRDYGHSCKEGSIITQNGHIYGIEVVTSSIQSAELIVELLCSAYTLMNGSMPIDTDDIIENLSNTSLWITGFHHHWYNACRVVQLAHNNHSYRIAIAKYYSLLSTCNMNEFRYDDTTPCNLAPTSPIFQTQIALLMVGSYSILEELHLQVQASKDNPSTINGLWNPVVYDELRNRLKQNSISPSFRFVWFRKGNTERPFKREVDTSMACPSSYASAPDFFITIVDAIFELSYMRSNFGAHKSKGNALNSYDAQNALNLIRTVLLQFFHVIE